ncbi:MAG: FecR domain-containing protein [Pyrinomonadaceae bacterium]
MKRNDQELGQLIDRAAAGIRNELLDQTAVDSAAGRAWARIAAEFADAAPATAAAQSANMRGCADFQSLITPYLKHELSSARTLLFEDHTHECVPCRRALKDARSGARLAPTMAADTFNKAGETLLNRPAARWAVAASVVLVFGLAMVPLMRRLTPLGGGLDPIVQAVDGAVFSIDDARAEAIGVGTTLKKGERIRTAKEGGAIVRLPDGSLVEMRERSEFSVSANGAGTTIHLERGSVIVQAAKQRAGHLFVATDDCLVSVTGTVFSVNSGTKGSRVSVIEGEVHVNHGNAKDVLRPGDQVSTRNNLERVSVEQEVAWSRDAERYQKALAGLQELRSDLASNVPVPGVRYSTRLLDAVPAQTALYAALPNLSNTIVESYRVLQEQIGKHEALREWWGREEKTQQQQVEGRSGDARAQQVIEKIRQFGSYLGEEIVVSVGVDAGGKPGAPLVIAELKDAAGFKYALESELRNVGGSTNQGEARVKFVADPLAQNFDGAQGEGALYVWIRDDLFAASPVHDQLKQLAINLASPQANSFKNTAFYARLADVYRDGAGLVVGADLQQILAHSLAEPPLAKSGGRERWISSASPTFSISFWS